MKAKVIRGSGFRGALDYVLGKGDGQIVGGVMAGQTARQLATEFGAVRKMRPDVKKPVWHCSLSLPAGDTLDAKKWDQLAADFMRRMEFPADTPWVAVRHHDTDHDHIHIVASRVSLAGQVWHGKWEARRAIEATQALEQAHELTLTPGLGEPKPAAALKKGEIEMAIRTQKEPPKQALQRLVKEAASGGPTALQFAERLTLAGVGVRANIASTGRLSGFSFEYDGIAFKASQLGKAYSWAALQREFGVTYEQDEQREALERLSAAAGDREQTARPGEQPSAPGSTAGSDRSGAGDIRNHDSGPAAGAGRDDSAADAAAAGHDPRAGGQPEQDVSVSRSYAHGSGADEPAGKAPESRSERARAPVRAESMDSVSGPDAGRDTGRGRGTDWSARFRAASAAKRRAAERKLGNGGVVEGHTTGARVDAADRVAARELDPTFYLENQGFTVKREGRHLSVRDGRDEVYRVTQKPDGRWLWCDRYGNAGGDNIALVQDIEPGVGFADAVYRLAMRHERSHGRDTHTRARVATTRKPPTLPPQPPEAVLAGREYLSKRYISNAVIQHAEACGMVRYCAGGVLFVGYDHTNTPQNATRRATDPADPVQRRDLRGSDKQYPPVLPGDPAKVWLVEGGADALAIHDLYADSGQQPPTVLVTSGANVLSWANNTQVQALLKNARKVVVAEENETSETAELRAGAGHQKQIEALEALGCSVQTWKPDGAKDAADLNATIKRQKYAESREAAAKGYDRGL